MDVDGWIAPGEFRFCPAGRHLSVGAHPCAICERRRGPRGYAYALRREKLVREMRQLLAEGRRDAGVEKLFWMKG